MSQETATRNLIIDLSNAYTPAALDAGSILHEAQLASLMQRVAEIVARVPAFKAQLEKTARGNAEGIGYGRSHDVITVHGKRGSGKTTFLLTVLNLLHDKKQRTTLLRTVPNSRDLDKLCVLDIMDPTLFGLHEHLLLTLLSKVAQKVRAHAAQRRASLCEDTEGCPLEKWEENLRRLAKGLKFVGETRDDLDSVQGGVVPRWEDAECLLERGMSNALQGLELERRFHMFLDESLKFLGKTAFVLALDDVDTRPAIGWHVLEVLRRYFTTPQLVVILSGDMDLFKNIIEKKQLAIFGLKFDSSYGVLERFKSRVDGLTEQYLLKILRTPVRVSLGNFQTALQQWKQRSPAVHLCVKKSDGTEAPLDTVLSRLYSLLGVDGAKEHRLFEKALLANPARTVVQVLDALAHGDAAAQVDRLREVFLVSLQNLGFEQPLELSEALQGPQGIVLLMKKLFAHDAYTQGLELLPTLSDGDVNNAWLALQGELTAAMRRDSAVLFAYIFKACLLRQIFLLREDHVTDRSYTEVENYLALERDELPSMTAARMTTLHWGDDADSNALLHRGAIRLYAKSITKSKPRKAMWAMYGVEEVTSEEDVPPQLREFYNAAERSEFASTSLFRRRINTPETLRDTLPCWQQDLVGLGVVDIRKGDASFRSFSVFPLLAVMADVLAGGHENMSLLLEGYAQIPGLEAYGGRFYFQKDEDEEREEAEDDTPGVGEMVQGESLRVGYLREKLEAWQQAHRSKDWRLPTTLCARIMSRFFRALERIDELRAEDTFVGLYVHRCLVAFFNSVLVEEFLLSPQAQTAEGRRQNLRLSAPAVTDGVFLENMDDAGLFEAARGEQKPEGGQEESRRWTLSSRYPLFEAVFSFPLWGLYLCSVRSKIEDDTVFAMHRNLQKDAGRDYTTIFYGKAGVALPNLYPVLNSLAVPKPDRVVNALRRRRGALPPEAENLDERERNRERAKLRSDPPRLEYKKIVQDVMENAPALLEPFRGSTGRLSAEFRPVFMQIVDMYYPDSRQFRYLRTPEACKRFWTSIKQNLK